MEYFPHLEKSLFLPFSIPLPLLPFPLLAPIRIQSAPVAIFVYFHSPSFDPREGEGRDRRRGGGGGKDAALNFISFFLFASTSVSPGASFGG